MQAKDNDDRLTKFEPKLDKFFLTTRAKTRVGVDIRVQIYAIQSQETVAGLSRQVGVIRHQGQ